MIYLLVRFTQGWVAGCWDDYFQIVMKWIILPFPTIRTSKYISIFLESPATFDPFDQPPSEVVLLDDVIQRTSQRLKDEAKKPTAVLRK